MKRVYWLVPCLATTLFAGYYHEWSKQPGDVRVNNVPATRCDPFAEYSQRDGRDDAERDWARGTPRYLSYGLPAHWSGEFSEILKRDYGVDRQAVAGCVVSEDLVKYVEAYNAVTQQHLQTIYGPQFAEKAVQKAEALYAERHPAPSPPIQN